jgi:hypothetical protein
LGFVTPHAEAILLLLILPYLLTALANRSKRLISSKDRISSRRFHVIALILSQLLPTASSCVMLTLISYETNVTAVANFVIMERAVAIGGSLVYFYARVKENLAQLALRVVVAFLLLAGILFMSMEVSMPVWLVAGCYLAAGSLLSYGTISLAGRYARCIFAINGIALLSLLLVPRHWTGLLPVQIYAIYICPQLLLMGGVLTFACRQNV